MAAESSMKITWLGHACFKVESGEYAVVIDPYEDNYVAGLGKIRETADKVLCTHGHRDHNYVEAVTLQEKWGRPFEVTAIPTWHDDKQGALRGENTMYILDNGSLRVAHLGDLGCDLTEEQEKQLGGLDAVMIPVGGYYTIDARQAKQVVDRIRPRVVIPMHYRGGDFGYDVLGTLDEFTDLCDVVVEYPGNELEIFADTEPHVAVLKVK